MSQLLSKHSTSHFIKEDLHGPIKSPLASSYTTSPALRNNPSHLSLSPSYAQRSPIVTKRSVSFTKQEYNSFPPTDTSQRQVGEQGISSGLLHHRLHDTHINTHTHLASGSLEKESFLELQKENTIPTFTKAGSAYRGLQRKETTTETAPNNTNSQHFKKPIIPSSGYGKFGQINFRADNLAMICKKWTKGGYWLHVYPATINLFDNLQDMEEWKKLNDSKTCSINTNDKNHSSIDMKTKRYMNQLVKKSINFDTTGELKKKMMKLEEKCSGNRTSRKKNKLTNGSQNNALPKTYIMEEVRSKHYHQNEPLMHTCKISYLGISGRHVTAAFGSMVPQEIKRLRAVLRTIIKLVKKATKKHSKKSLVVDAANANWNISSAKSEITALSNTVYGQNTTFKKRF